MKVNVPATLAMLLCFFASCTGSKDKSPETNTHALLGEGIGISNATLLVQNLDSARNYFTDVLGFNMPKPDKFQNGMYEGTLSASISFADFSSFELLGVKDTAIVAARYPYIKAYLKQYEGMRTFGFSTSSVDTTNKWLHAQGLKTSAIQSGRVTREIPKGWDWDDGGPQWRSVQLDSQPPPAYRPAFVEFTDFPYKELEKDWKPYAWRRYYDTNANGAVGIASLQLVVSDLKAVATEFEKMGLKQLEANDSSARFKIAHDQELQVVVPRSPGDAFSQFLKARGPGVYAIRFDIKSYNVTRAFLQKTLPAAALVADSVSRHLTVLKEYAHGVQLEFIQEPKERAELAKIYDYNDDSALGAVPKQYASAIYTKYCALCHGKDREGYAADHAPSLRSHALMATTQSPRSSYNYLHHSVAYGRAGTAMAPYAKEQGGPLDREDIDLLIKWLHDMSGAKAIEMSTDPIKGNVAQGKLLYAKHCASCHGENGQGVRAPALANPMFLTTASDAFLRYTITEGRGSTPMKAFKDSLTKTEINALTAYIRSRASGWNAPEAVTIVEPQPKDYILNPHNKAPAFTLKEGRYVPAVQLVKALKDSARMVILDARSAAAWHQTHIPGAVSVPYYKEPDKFIKDIPNDSTWIVVYCACPHAASQQVVNTLTRFGYKHTAILDEGIIVWAGRGYPVQYGEGIKATKK